MKISEINLAPRERELLAMLTYMRPAGSDGERAFIARFLDPLGCRPDGYGNRWLDVGPAGPDVLWSCHTDTVHKHSGPQALAYGAHVVTAPKSDCLGADCTTGVWLMVNMIRAGIAGRYVFHLAEEVGGLGSDYVARHEPERLAGIQVAIAFDRKGYRDVITHQMGGRCASDACAQSIADVLGLDMVPSDKGTFTDTANYAGIVPECVNLAVGYFQQHTSAEYQDVAFAARLLDRILSADWSRLVCQRDPADDWPNAYGSGDGPDDLRSYVRDFPEDVAAFLADHGYTTADVDNWTWHAMRVAGKHAA